MSTGSLSDAEEVVEGGGPDTESQRDVKTEADEFEESDLITSVELGDNDMAKRDHRSRKRSAGRARVYPPGGLRCSDGDERQGQRSAANARERARMRVLSKAFSRLKTTLPWVPPDTKLSKLDTLRLASSYIAHLRHLLADGKCDGGAFSHPISLTWPFLATGHTDLDSRSRSVSSRLCGAPMS
uniref:Musculin (activated B-cell factor-1) n=1 Tax=Eptatretus burgeri TaxID=7764 RepID=A0A8C4WVK9_EPTBU